jgi:hypothetical protein
MCEPNCESDHYLVKTVVKEKFIMIPNNYVWEGNLNKGNLQDQNKLKQYRQYLHWKVRGGGGDINN